MALPRVKILEKQKGRLTTFDIECDIHQVVVAGLSNKVKAMRAAIDHAEEIHKREARIQHSV